MKLRTKQQEEFKGEKQRLQKIIAFAGICSRRKAENLIASGRVFLNGKKAILGDKAEIGKDKVEVCGRVLSVSENKVYYMLNKPKAVLSENKKMLSKDSIYDLPSVRAINERVFHVGRLDFMSEGLLMLTNDGDFANKIAHPRGNLEKVYYIRAEPEFTAEDLKKLENIDIEGDEIETKVKKISQNEVEITLHEGKNRIVRKIMEKIGKRVYRLVRIKIGKLELGNLKSGEIRELREKEVKDFFD